MYTEKVYKVAGEEPPFLYGTKVCFERLGRVIVEHGVKVVSSCVFKSGQRICRGDSFVLSLEIPASKIDEVEKDLHCTLTEHPDIQIGNDIIKSAKWKDDKGNIYHFPYPNK